VSPRATNTWLIDYTPIIEQGLSTRPLVETARAGEHHLRVR
jgi:hypothetical protein